MIPSIQNHSAYGFGRTAAGGLKGPMARFGASPQNRGAAPQPAPARPDPYTTYVDGLEGIVGGVTQVGHIEPNLCSLVYRGYDIRDLAEKSNYEETAYLLLNGKLPNAGQARAFSRKIRTQRDLPKEVIKTIKRFPKDANPMDVLRTAVSMLALYDPQAGDNSHKANVEKAIRLIARIPTIIAAHHRISNGQKPIDPDPRLNQSQNFLYMLTGKKPKPHIAKVFGATMILYAEHGFNASTYSSRVTSSTLSDIYSGVTAAIGTLKGPLHGGANEEAMKMLLEIGTEANAEPYIMQALAQKKKIMGFGHRVYKNGDTRAPILKRMGDELSRKLGGTPWPRIADKVEQVMMREKKLHPNVDFPTAYLYYMMGLPIKLYTPLFAAARVAGWSAHIIEQLDNNRLIRPKSLYNGAPHRPYVPIGQRK